MDRLDGTVRYVLTGEGAGTIFQIDENTGDLQAIKKLDREEKANYTLQVTAVNTRTNQPLEPQTEFIIKIHDINDNEPKFAKATYTASIPEMTAVGKCVFLWFFFTIVFSFCAVNSGILAVTGGPTRSNTVS